MKLMIFEKKNEKILKPKNFYNRVASFLKIIKFHQYIYCVLHKIIVPQYEYETKDVCEI